MRSPPLYRLAVFLTVAGPSTSMAAAPPNVDTPHPAESRAEAFAECGGPPIQDGRRVQPTPARDKCLAEKQNIPRPGHAGNTPQTKERPPVIPPADLQPIPRPNR
jgi:hypothetical protein